MDKENNIIGYWISEKKQQKLNWKEFNNICEQKSFILKQINLDNNLESQGPFHVFLHKLTDTLALAECGDQNAKKIVTKVQEYLNKHPEMILIDPFENVKNLNNRQKSYEMLHEEIISNDIFVPNSIELKSEIADENLKHLRLSCIKFPFICKPLFAHGSSDAHKMMVIFNEKGLKNCQLPCVAQNFINHNAILHKVFIVGKYFHVVERPSLKNFYPSDCESLNTLFFSSHDISKSGSNSQWSVISKEDRALRIKPNHETVQDIVTKITKIFGLTLLGVDVVIENHTGKYAIIDVNVFPGYDGYPHFFNHLIDTIKVFIDEQRLNHNMHCLILKKCMNDELDSGFESDDKKKQSIK
ncbi:inositol-tetrakisphosphate 1-kinase-like [Microplitis mediator]|uniref:inositol-tetrakisphosphate 1-kinase-like n=1 Tax=Microplitis mediator TaxID=375433 RepID=UPI0025570177|nr:inositol-tetrakisphosphate 1-kinase-like [Microplitis mediator]